MGIFFHSPDIETTMNQCLDHLVRQNGVMGITEPRIGKGLRGTDTQNETVASSPFKFLLRTNSTADYVIRTVV